MSAKNHQSHPPRETVFTSMPEPNFRAFCAEVANPAVARLAATAKPIRLEGEDRIRVLSQIQETRRSVLQECAEQIANGLYQNAYPPNKLLKIDFGGHASMSHARAHPAFPAMGASISPVQSAYILEAFRMEQKKTVTDDLAWKGLVSEADANDKLKVGSDNALLNAALSARKFAASAEARTMDPVQFEKKFLAAVEKLNHTYMEVSKAAGVKLPGAPGSRELLEHEQTHLSANDYVRQYPSRGTTLLTNHGLVHGAVIVAAKASDSGQYPAYQR